MSKIVISVGHTPQDPGAKAGSLVEFELATKISNEVISILKDQKYDAYGVPYDLDLAATINWINTGAFSSSENDVCIDIHINDGGGSGIEGWYRDRGENKSAQLTKSIVSAVAKETGLPSIGAKSEYDHPFKSLAFVHNTECVSALIECGFIDNAEDAALLGSEEGIKKFAIGIVNGIKDYLSSVGKEKKDVSEHQKAFQSSNIPLTLGNEPLSLGGSQAGGMGVLNERRELIRRLYREVLGREADTKGVAYYMYSNPTALEDQIRKEMTQSTEHVEMVKLVASSEEKAKHVTELEEEISILRVNLESRENELANLQKLLQMKNHELKKLRIECGKTSPANEMKLSTPKEDNFQTFQSTSRPKGCIGWLRALIGF